MENRPFTEEEIQMANEKMCNLSSSWRSASKITIRLHFVTTKLAKIK